MLPTMLLMKTIKYKIKKVIQQSNGYPNYTQMEYLIAIKHLLKEELSNAELDYIKRNKINLNSWIMNITVDLTKDNF